MGVAKHIVDRFIVGVKDCKSIDCVLIKLTSALYDVRSYAQTMASDSPAQLLIHEFLHDPEVMGVLSGLAHEKEYIEMKIHSDPRFSLLRQYSELVISSIDAAGRSVKPSTVFTADSRAPTWRVEWQEEVLSRAQHRRIGVRSRRGYGTASRIRALLSSRKMIILVVVVVLLVVIAIAAMNMGRVVYR